MSKPDAVDVVKMMFIIVVLLIGVSLCVRATAEEFVPHGHGKYTVGVGAGTSNSEGSGVVHISSMKDRFKLFAMIWTDNNDNGKAATAQTTTTQSYRYRYRSRKKEITTTTVVTPGTDGDTANLAVGVARIWDYKMVSGGLGVAYVADDDTDNIGQHFQVYIEGMVKTPKKWWVQGCGVWHLSDADSGGSGETFVGCEKEI